MTLPILPSQLVIKNITEISYSEETKSIIIQTEQVERLDTRYLLNVEIGPEALQDIVAALLHFAKKQGKSIEDLCKPPTFQ